MRVFVNYIRTNGTWTYTVQRGKVKAQGDDYAATRKGTRDMKRDCANILEQLRKKQDEIIINRYK